MKAHLKVRRFNPERDAKPWWGEYSVEVHSVANVLDALHEVKWQHDGSLTLRRSCGHGVCGSDAMRINGRNGLACKQMVGDYRGTITVEPLLGFKVIKDLVVDMDSFWARHRSILPFLVNDQPAPERERLQTPEQRARFDDTTKCILCAACTTSCPVFWSDTEYLGPAAIVQAHRFIFDSRDQAKEQRLAILNEKSGVWKCRTIFNCTDACPRGIEVTRAIGEVKQELLLRTF